MIYTFLPYLKSVIWGGEKIKALKGIVTDQECIGESWEISGVPGHESVVADGNDKGMKLPELIDKYKGDLVGKEVYARFGNKFPLLVKIIDAKQGLSVQVHPDDALAEKRHNSLGKTEMWYIMDTDKDAKIYAGLSEQIDPDKYTELVAENKIMDVIAKHDSHPGDLFFLPAGRIHAIGAGNLLAEIQETSDITYRVYDFDRRDAQGNPRELHTELAKDAIDYTVYPSYTSDYDRQAKGETELVKCPYFIVDRVAVEGETPLRHSSESFTIVMCLDGDCTIESDGERLHMRPGMTALVSASAVTLSADGLATLITARI